MKKRLFLALLIIFSIFTVEASAAFRPVMVSKAAIYGGNAGVSVYALMYHKLTENPQELSDYCIYPETFEEDIIFLKEKGYGFASPEDLREGRLETGKKYVLITFDDGYSSDYKYALPILEKHQVPATFFVVSGLVGKDDYMTPEELNLLAQSPYVTVGSHTDVFHNFVPNTVKDKIATGEGRFEYLQDVRMSVAKLESITGKLVNNFSYPYGAYNVNIEYDLREAFPNLITFSSDLKVNVINGKSLEMVGRYNRGNGFVLSSIIK